MRFLLTACSWLGIDVRRMRGWLITQHVRFFHSRTRKCEAFLKLYDDRRPMTSFRQTLWEIRYHRWAVEMAFWTDRTTGVRVLKDVAKKHWTWRKHYWWQLRRDLALSSRIRIWRSNLKYFFRPQNLKKKLYRRLKRMPEVYVTSNNGIRAVVLQRDLKRAKRIFFGYSFSSGQEEMIVGGNYGDPFVPHRTMIFAKPTAQSFTLRRSASEIVAGTPDDMNELLRGCVVHNLPRKSFFVPYSSYRELLEWQREQFPPVSLEGAYRLVWGGRRQPPATS